MKLLKTITIICIVPFLWNCDKNENKTNTPKLIEINGGTCNAKELKQINDKIVEQDTVTYTISNGNLNLQVGFNENCCSEFSASSLIENNTIIIKIKTEKFGLCNCLCYHIYEFK